MDVCTNPAVMLASLIVWIPCFTSTANILLRPLSPRKQASTSITSPSSEDVYDHIFVGPDIDNPDLLYNNFVKLSNDVGSPKDLATSDKSNIVNALNQTVNAVNITAATASSNGDLSDALLLGLDTGSSPNNFSKKVAKSFTTNLPSDCGWGIRTVYWLGTDSVCVQINGVTADGLTSKIWHNCYNHGTWTGWRSN